MEPFCNIIKWAIIQRTSGYGSRVLYAKWSKGPSPGHFYAAATEALLLAYCKKLYCHSRHKCRFYLQTKLL